MNFSKNKIPATWLGLLALILLIWSIFSALKLPIYPDEVAYKIFIERFFYNGGYKQSVTPYCTAGFLVRPNLVLLPASAFGALLTLLGGDWWSYRVTPFLLLVLILALVVTYSNIQSGKTPWPALLVLTITPCIYGLIILRPEIFILFGGLVIYLAAFKLLDEKISQTKIWITSFVIAFLFSFLVFLHPKSLYLAPITALFYLYALNAIRNKSVKIFYFLLFVALIFQISISAIELHRVQFLTCTEVPKIQLGMNLQSINLLSLFGDPAHFFKTISQIFNIDFLERALSQFTFKKNFDIDYLPSIEKNNLFILVINVLNISIILALIVGIFFASLIGWLFMPLRKYLLLVALTFGFFTPYFLNLSKNWYENSFFLGAVAIIFALYYPFLVQIPFSKITKIRLYYLKLILSTLLIFSSIGTAILIDYKFSKKFREGYSGPGISIYFKRDSIGESTRYLLSHNSIKSQNGFIVDDLTYDSLKTAKVIIPVTYLSLVGEWPIIVNQSLASQKVHYGLTRCVALTSLNPDLQWTTIESFHDPYSNEEICLFQSKF